MGGFIHFVRGSEFSFHKNASASRRGWGGCGTGSGASSLLNVKTKKKTFTTLDISFPKQN